MRFGLWALGLLKTCAPLLLVLILCLPALLPLAGPGFPRTDDGFGHLFRIVELDRALRAGVLYPRWAPELAMGYGYPVLNYYAPLSYYAVEVLHLVGLGFLAAYKASLGVALLLTGLAAYLLARDVLDDRLAAVLSAVAYAVAPYTLADAALRGALGESWTFVFIPLTLWAFRRLVITRRPAYIAASALSLAALILSHNAIALMTLPLLLAYVAFLLGKETRFLPENGFLTGIALVLLALTLALALAAFYWLPALAEKPYTRVDDLLTGFHGGVAGQLVEPWRLVQFSPAYDYAFDPTANPFRLGLVQALAALAGLIAVIGRAFQASFCHPERSEGSRFRITEILRSLRMTESSLLFFAGATACVLFLMTPLSLFLWDTVPLIAFVEFPWRLLTLAGLGTALLAGGLVAALPARPVSVKDGVAPGASESIPRLKAQVGLSRLGLSACEFIRRWPWRGAVFLVAVLALVAAGLWDLHPPRSSITEAEVNAAVAARFDYNVGAIGTNKASEYLPLTVQENPTQIPRGDLLARGVPAGPTPDLALLRADPMAVDLVTNANSPGGPVVLHQFAFPGWAAWVDDQPTLVMAAGSLGLACIDVPAGAHRISFRFMDTPARTQANQISLAGLVALLGVAIWAALAWIRSWRRPAMAGVLVLVLLFALPGDRNLVPRRFTEFHMWPEPPVIPRRVDFGPGLRLLGYQLDTSRLDATRELDVTLYWQARQPLTTSHIVDVGLVDRRKVEPRVLAVYRGVPVYGCTPTTKWEVGEIVVDRHTLRLVRGAPPGIYWLAVAVRRTPQGSYIEVTPGQVVAWLWETGGKVPPDRVQTPQHEKYVPLQGILELEGFDTDPAFTGDALPARPGQTLVVTPHWRAADAGVPVDYTIRLTLRDGAGQVVAQADYEPIYDAPATSLWGLDWRDARALPFALPAALPPGDYALECELYHGYDEQRLWPLRADRAAFDLFAVRVQ